MVFEDIKKTMAQNDYVVWDSGFNMMTKAEWIRFIHKKNHNIILVEEDFCDDEEIAHQTFNMDDDEFEERVMVDGEIDDEKLNKLFEEEIAKRVR